MTDDEKYQRGIDSDVLPTLSDWHNLLKKEQWPLHSPRYDIRKDLYMILSEEHTKNWRTKRCFPAQYHKWESINLSMSCTIFKILRSTCCKVGYIGVVRIDAQYINIYTSLNKFWVNVYRMLRHYSTPACYINYSYANVRECATPECSQVHLGDDACMHESAVMCGAFSPLKRTKTLYAMYS